jgi:hypothetical protein
MIKATEILKEIKNASDVESFIKDNYKIADEKAIELAKETVDAVRVTVGSKDNDKSI